MSESLVPQSQAYSYHRAQWQRYLVAYENAARKADHDLSEIKVLWKRAQFHEAQMNLLKFPKRPEPMVKIERFEDIK
jgi:hypothetical protein